MIGKSPNSCGVVRQYVDCGAFGSLSAYLISGRHVFFFLSNIRNKTSLKSENLEYTSFGR